MRLIDFTDFDFEDDPRWDYPCWEDLFGDDCDVCRANVDELNEKVNTDSKDQE